MPDHHAATLDAQSWRTSVIQLARTFAVGLLLGTMPVGCRRGASVGPIQYHYRLAICRQERPCRFHSPVTIPHRNNVSRTTSPQSRGFYSLENIGPISEFRGPGRRAAAAGNDEIGRSDK
jgi:hypothetical protein